MKRVLLAIPLLVSLLTSTNAFATVPEYGTFVADKACPLYTSVKKQKNPGKRFTMPYKQYKVVARNRHGGEWLRVDLPKVKPNLRWVNVACGSKASKANKGAGKGASTTASSNTSIKAGARTQGGANVSTATIDTKTTLRSDTTTRIERKTFDKPRKTLSLGRDAQKPQKPAKAKQFKPFFDNIKQGRFDHTPKPPKLNAFDDAVLKVCGKWGQHPISGDFRVMLDKPELRPYLESLHKRLGGKVLKSGDMRDFKNQLTAVWFARDGFTHVFCGEPDSRQLGGLHYVGRFWQMQQEDWGGPMDSRDCRPRVKVGTTYALGVSYRRRGGRIENDCIKSYAYTMNAEDLLVAGTKALRDAGRAANAGRNMACLVNVTDNGRNFYMRLVASRGGVRSLFPLDKPRCDKGRVSRCECKNIR